MPKSIREAHMEQNLQLMRLPSYVFRAVDRLSDSRGLIRFLDPSRHLGFDIFDGGVRSAGG